MSKKILRLLRLAIRQVGIAYASLTGKRKKQIRASCRTYAVSYTHLRRRLSDFLTLTYAKAEVGERTVKIR